MVEELGINRFLFAILISFIFSAQLSQTPFFIFIVIVNFYSLQIDFKPWSTNFTIGFVGRRLGDICPKLYYHLSSVRQVYARIILIWQQNESYMRSSTTSHKNQFSRRLDNKNNCYKELKNETFIEQNLITQWEITKESTKKV